MRARFAATLVAALALGAPPAAAAQAVSAGELAALAERAATDGDARAELLAVERVDGQPVAVRQSITG